MFEKELLMKLPKEKLVEFLMEFLNRASRDFKFYTKVHAEARRAV